MGHVMDRWPSATVVVEVVVASSRVVTMAFVVIAKTVVVDSHMTMLSSLGPIFFLGLILLAPFLLNPTKSGPSPINNKHGASIVLMPILGPHPQRVFYNQTVL